MRHRMLTIPVLLLAIALIGASVSAAQGETIIRPLSEATFTVSPGETLVLRAGWAAASRQRVRTAIRAINYRVWLSEDDVWDDDEIVLEPEDVDALWGPIEPWECPEPCPFIPNTVPHAAFWRYQLPALSAGTHYVHTVFWLDHPLPDGGWYDRDEDGHRDPPGQGSLYAEGTVTIIVQ